MLLVRHGLARTRVSLMAESKSWRPGDRVIVRLPDRTLPRGQGGSDPRG